jgi:hypothetical protein
MKKQQKLDVQFVERRKEGLPLRGYTTSEGRPMASNR